MAYDEFTAKMVRRVDALEQALAEKEREITHLQDVYTKQRHKQEDAQRQVIEGLQKRLALLQADDAERCTLIRDMEEEERRKDGEIERQAQQIAGLREALQRLVDLLGGDASCRVDHHGYCQEHFLTAPCEVQQAIKEVKP